MNIQQERTAFYERQEREPLNSPAVALWYALMDAYEKAGFPQSFPMSVKSLTLRTGGSERTFYYARRKLMKRGFIKYSEGKYTILSLVTDNKETQPEHENRKTAIHAGKSAEEQWGYDSATIADEHTQPWGDYTAINAENDAEYYAGNRTEECPEEQWGYGSAMIAEKSAENDVASIAEERVEQPWGYDTANVAEEFAGNAAEQSFPGMSINNNISTKDLKGFKDLKKHKILKPKKPKSFKSLKGVKHISGNESNTGSDQKKTSSPMDLYVERGFGKMSTYIAKEITKWQNETSFTEPESMLLHAMNIAVRRGKRHWRYVTGILENWRKSGCTTVRQTDTFHHTNTQGGKKNERNWDAIFAQHARSFLRGERASSVYV
ncbi:DnaD domain-containing protein [Alteribacillus iranensis]|uniref:DnaD and phage-associated domain-containing protein n=1 Tax=Alteribacillus iranensis TaxID=930128 RepID=A0A1I1ZRV2_9BACI|nr:DnaD domain protein [Alteribacillus iranensis]SFE33170.1 DnaD and phage-associated domain-containing protein [Alteribacillus iranensis]